MIKIIFYVQGSNYVGLDCTGHADYAEYGSDIVCASISTLAGSLALGLKKVLNLKIDYKVNEKNAKLELRLPKGISDEDMKKAQVLFKTTYLSMEDVCNGYPENIKMEVKTYVY